MFWQVTPGIPGVKPVTIEMIDANTKALVETLEVDACMVCTGRAPFSDGLGLADINIDVSKTRGFVQVDDCNHHASPPTCTRTCT